MVPTRRQALGGIAALLVALAGCNGTTDTPPPDDGDDENRFERPENVAMDPPTVTLRRAGSRDPIVEVSEADGEVSRTERERRRAVERGFVTTDEAVSWLHIDDVDGADTARRFLSETDFESAFVFIDRGGVQQCYEQVLCYVTWSEFELRRTYAQVYRDYDVACSTDERDRVTRFIRLRGSVDVRQIEPGVTHTQRGGCPVPRWQLDDRSRHQNETNATTATGASVRPGDADARIGRWH